MQQPPYLKQGSMIGITCASGYMPAATASHAVTVLKQWGLDVKVSRTVGLDEQTYFAGNDEERLQSLQEMLDDPTLDAILLGRGGYGLSRIIDAIDFTVFRNKPKWICGFSDVTVLHSHIQQNFGICTLHSPMCAAFKQGNEQADHILKFKNAITGKPLSYQIATNTHNKSGSAEGIMTGGNLSLLVHLIGTASDIDSTGKVLFLEDTGEAIYHVDRMLLQLKRAGKFEGLAGLLIGSFDNIRDTQRTFGQSLEEVVLDKVKDYDYPVCFNFPAGHEDINYTLTMGMPHRLRVDNSGGQLELIR
jgi:muramoyltetrapeptide carboxypeptidase